MASTAIRSSSVNCFGPPFFFFFPLCISNRPAKQTTHRFTSTNYRKDVSPLSLHFSTAPSLFLPRSLSTALALSLPLSPPGYCSLPPFYCLPVPPFPMAKRFRKSPSLPQSKKQKQKHKQRKATHPATQPAARPVAQPTAGPSHRSTHTATPLPAPAIIKFRNQDRQSHRVFSNAVPRITARGGEARLINAAV